jgi:protein-S-isoprenylcysteine O-methyltransferase Ste14
MKTWTPNSLYGAKPWVMVAIGAVLAIGSMVWSLHDGSWTVWRSLACFAGALLAASGGAIIQMRQIYRARSKWRRAGLR